MKIPVKLIRILTIVFATLLCVMIAACDVLSTFSKNINHFLGVQTSIVVKNENDDTDTAYFKSDYSTNTFDPNTGKPIYADGAKERLTKDAEAIGREIEGEGLVLLKNENALPLAEGSKVSLFGQGSVNFNYGSTGSSAASTSKYPVLKQAMEQSGFSVNGALWNYYSDNITARSRRNINEIAWSSVKSATESTYSAYGDAAIVVISRDSGEGTDVPATGTDGMNGNYLALSQQEIDMLVGLTQLKSTTFKKIIVVLNSSATIQLDFLANPSIKVDACLWVGNVGKSGIYAVSDVLCGKVVPSGRLSDTYVYDNFSSPAMASWALNPNMAFSQRYTNYNSVGIDNKLYGVLTNYGVYVEGIYLGYRYYETRYEDVVLGADNAGDYNYSNVVAYPFGHGLSYAEFEYSDFNVTEAVRDGETYFDISLKVTNVSDKYDGKEVVQIYLQKPYDATTKLEKASVELVGFTKTKELKHNGSDDEKSQVVTVTVSKEQFASYDVNANGGKGGYVLDKGNYYLAVGKDAHDALNNILAAKAGSGVSLSAEKMTAAGKKDFTYSWNLASRDESSYFLSTETLKPVTNQLDFADINRYENKGSNSVTYLSRSDWSGTWPKAPVKLTLTTGMVEDLQPGKPLPTETNEQMPEYGVDSNISLVMLRSDKDNVIEYDNQVWETFLDQMTFEQQSLLLSNAAFGTNEFKAPLNKPATKDNDGPTGVVNSTTGSSFPSEGIWASSFNTELIERVGKILAEDALFNGYHCMYATGINMHRTPYGGRSHEYFSEDPYLSGVAVCYEVSGMQSKGVIPTLKHFAFNDEEDQRSGICIWLNEQEAREIMLKPFEMAMRPSQGNAHAIMTSFNRAGCIWTSASSELMINIARTEWDFDGYSITDMADSFMSYMVFDDGIMNGTDTYLTGQGGEYALSDYAYSIPFRLRMREACHRVLYTICNYSAAMNGVAASDKIVPVTPAWQVAVYVVLGLFAVLTAAGAGLWCTSYVLNLKNNKKENENVE